MKERMPVGFMFKQISTIYEKEFNNRLRKLGITASQCAVLDYLFNASIEEVTQKDIEKGLNLKNPTVTGILKRLEEGCMLTVKTAEHNGRLRKYYTITDNGLKRLEEFKNEWKEILSIYQFVIKGDEKHD